MASQIQGGFIVNSVPGPDLQSAAKPELTRQGRDLGMERIDYLPVTFVILRARPAPIGGPSTQSSFDRIPVDVVERGLYGLDGEQVAIVAGTFLPVAKHVFARPLPHGQRLEQTALTLFQVSVDTARQRILDLQQQRAHFLLGTQSPNQQMHVFGHVHERGQTAAEVRAGIINAPREPGPPDIVREERPTLVAREREFVNVTRLVKVLDLLANGFLHRTTSTSPPA